MVEAAQRIEEPVVGAEPPTAPRRRRRVIARILLAVLLAIFAVWLVLYVTKGRFLKHPFERFVAGQTHREVRVGGDFQLYFAPFRLKLVAEKMTIANPAWASKPYFFAADRLDTRIAPLSLVFGDKRRLYWLLLDNGAVDLEWNAAHTANTWTFSDRKGGKPLPFPRIDRAQVTGTTVRFLDPKMELLADLGIADIKSTNANIGQAVGVKGHGRIRSSPFTVTAQLLSPDATANRGQNKLRMEMHARGNVIDVAGTLPSIADIEGVPLAVKARGRNLAELLAIIGVAIPDTRAYHLAATLTKDDEAYRFAGLSGLFGDSDLSGGFTVHAIEPRTFIEANLRTRRLDIVDAAPFIGYNPDVVATSGAKAAAAQTGAAPQRLLPDAALQIDALKNFDARVHYAVGVVASKHVPISDVDLTLDLDDSELHLTPIRFAMARGRVAADVMIDAQRDPVHTDYDIRLEPTPMGRLLAGYGVAEAGTTGTIHGRIQLTGDGNTLHDSLSTSRGRIAFVMPSGTLWTRNVQLAELDIGTFVQKMFTHQLKEPVQINCGLVAFTVRNGIAAADPILIDTTKNVILGRGGFSFKSEAIDLAFRADAKKFSLFSGQSPVGLGGMFAKPALKVVTPQLLARAGAGLGLALVATPAAAILAFVDPGDAKAAACGPVLSAATANRQMTTKGQPRTDVGNGTPSTAKDGKTGSAQRKKFLGLF